MLYIRGFLATLFNNKYAMTITDFSIVINEFPYKVNVKDICFRKYILF